MCLRRGCVVRLLVEIDEKEAANQGVLEFSSTLARLEEQLDHARQVAVMRTEETTVARMYGASQALKLKKAQSELNVTLDEVRKQNRLRQRAEDASTKLRERIGELEKALSETLGPRTPKKECEGLTPEASQALIASLHDSHKKARDSEARLEQANSPVLFLS